MELKVIPKPLEAKVTDETKSFRLDAGTKISKGGLNKAAAELNAFLDKAFGYRLNESATGGVNMKLDLGLMSELGTEGYKLTVSNSGITLVGAEERGVFYAVETLKQLITQFIGIDTADLPYLEITDKPLYCHRGFMLDVARHFFTVEEVLRVIDTLALQKLNVFHWHLTEDQGWRIEIEKYPKLTTVGARRKGTLGDNKRHGGYYTKADIKRVVDYCADRFITVIPEIDLPGHSTAAAAAYNFLTCRGGALEVATSFGIKPEIFCAGKESTYKFLYDVLDELVMLFPGEYVHLGGDEAPKLRWKECPECKKTMAVKGLRSPEELQGYFLNKLVEHLKKKGKKVICWNESIYSKILDKSVICQYWNDGKEPLRVVNEMNAGRSGIISKFTPYYLDYPFAMHSLKGVYQFAPELAGLNEKADILGIEAPLWTEYVEDTRRIDYMIYPRLTALGEIAWVSRDKRDYADFESRLPVFLALLDIYNIKYAPKSDINPGFFKKIRQMVSFIKRIYSKESVKAMKESNKVYHANLKESRGEK